MSEPNPTAFVPIPTLTADAGTSHLTGSESADRLTEDGPELGGGNAARIAEVDLMMPPSHHQTLGRYELVVEFGEHRRFVVVGADMERLDGEALVERVNAK